MPAASEETFLAHRPDPRSDHHKTIRIYYFVHVLIFHVLLNFLSVLPCNHIDHIETLFPHLWC